MHKEKPTITTILQVLMLGLSCQSNQQLNKQLRQKACKTQIAPYGLKAKFHYASWFEAGSKMEPASNVPASHQLA